MYVLDALDMAVHPQRGGIEAHLAHHLEARLEFAQALQGGIAANELVVIEQDDAILIRHRHQRFTERAIGSGTCSLLLRAQGESIHIGATEAFQGGDQISTNTLWYEVGMDVGFRVHHPGTAV